ncbi:hypothetical protein [Flavobacterium sp. DSR3-2]|uniref:hypothetical protein n=1 Tax=Flavobacterium sp. DSR3-2 TaxID=2804634 RepID=UPI003CF962A2
MFPRKNQSYWLDFKLEVRKAVDKNSLSLRTASVKFNIPDAGIIAKGKKYFANFGLVALQPKTRRRLETIYDKKRKKRKSDKTVTRAEEILLEIKALRCENDLLKNFLALIQAEEKVRKRKP